MKQAIEAELALSKLSGKAKSALKFMSRRIETPPCKVTPRTLEELATAGLGRYYDGPTITLTGTVEETPKPGHRYFLLTPKGKRVSKFS